LANIKSIGVIKYRKSWWRGVGNVYNLFYYQTYEKKLQRK